MGAASPAVAVISGIYGVYSGIKQSKAASAAASKQERIARDNASNSRAETQEEARRLQREGDKAEAKGRSRAAASGVTPDGSMDIFLGSEKDEFDREVDWLKTSGENRASIIERSGANEAAITKETGKTALANSFLKNGLNVAQGASDWSSGYQGSNKSNKSWFNY